MKFKSLDMGEALKQSFGAYKIGLGEVCLQFIFSLKTDVFHCPVPGRVPCSLLSCI